jgi:fermentation-respiration switch protein FrsA (DUF1100 family)
MSEPATSPRRSGRVLHVQKTCWRRFLAILALRDGPFWTASIWRRLLRLAVFVVYVNLILLAILLPLENRLLFPGWSFPGRWYPPPSEMGVTDVDLASADGNKLHAWFVTPLDWQPSSGAVLYSHGNGGNLSMRQVAMDQWRRELDRAVLIYDYPGFGKSEGKPTEDSCYAAAEAGFSWLVQTQKVPPDEVILLGSSLGGAMATELAIRHDFRLLVLISSFTSFPDMAQKTVPWLPARWLVSNRMHNLDKIDQVRGPVFIAHGTADRVVPYWMGERLFEKAKEPRRFFRMDDHPHRHPTQPAFFRAVREYLDETKAERR